MELVMIIIKSFDQYSVVQFVLCLHSDQSFKNNKFRNKNSF